MTTDIYVPAWLKEASERARETLKEVHWEDLPYWYRAWLRSEDKS